MREGLVHACLRACCAHFSATVLPIQRAHCCVANSRPYMFYFILFRFCFCVLLARIPVPPSGRLPASLPGGWWCARPHLSLYLCCILFFSPRIACREERRLVPLIVLILVFYLCIYVALSLYILCGPSDSTAHLVRDLQQFHVWHSGI